MPSVNQAATAQSDSLAAVINGVDHGELLNADMPRALDLTTRTALAILGRARDAKTAQANCLASLCRTLLVS